MNWGSSTQAVTYRTILTMSYQYNAIADHVKNFRPQCLVLCDSPHEQSDLLYLVSHVTKNNGLMICGQVKDESSISNQPADYEKANGWLLQNKIKAFHTISTGTTTLTDCFFNIFFYPIQGLFYRSISSLHHGGNVGGISTKQSHYLSLIWHQNCRP